MVGRLEFLDIQGYAWPGIIIFKDLGSHPGGYYDIQGFRVFRVMSGWVFRILGIEDYAWVTIMIFRILMYLGTYVTGWIFRYMRRLPL